MRGFGLTRSGLTRVHCIDFDLGYFDGKHGTKRWLIEDEDIKNMYLKYTCGEIYLWLETLEEKTYEELLEKHKEKFSTHQLNLWARMIVNKYISAMMTPLPKTR